MILTLSIILCGCNNSSSVDEETFEEKYEAVQKKYEKYLNGPVSGQEVLDLIDNWARRGICIWIITDSTHFFIVFGICKRSGV